MRIRINNAHIVSPENDINKKGEVCLADGVITSVLKKNKDFTAEREIDAAGKILCPGVIDLAADFREPGQEHKATIASESRAAARAGVTSVVLSANTNPVVDTAAVVELIHQRQSCTTLLPLGALTIGLRGEQLTEMSSLQQAGCVALTNNLHTDTSSEVLRRALEYAASFNITVFIHANDPALSNKGVMHEGQVSTRLGLPGIPETAETVALSRYLLLIKQTGVKAHFCRITTARGMELVKSARQNGLDVTADISINNLFLSEVDVSDFNSNCHLQPPLRTIEDRNALLAGLAHGDIDAVCSDHQPHDEDAKCAPFSATESGATGLELLAPLLFTLVERKDLDLARAISAITSKPAGILGLSAGVIDVGRPADLFLFDQNAAWTVSTETLHSAGNNTPFLDWEMPGQVSHTIHAGTIVHE